MTANGTPVPNNMSPSIRPQVLLIAHSFATQNGGIARVSRLMAKVLAELNIPTLLIELDGDEQDPLFGLERQSCQGSKLRLIRTVRQHLSAYSHLIFDAPNRARIQTLLWPHQFKGLIFCHGIEIWEGAQQTWLKAARRADTLLCNSKYTKTRACHLHEGLEHLQVCPLSTEASAPKVAPTSSLKQSPPTVLIVARMAQSERYKGHRELIEAWPSIIQRIPEARLQIVGGGDDVENLKKLAQASPAHPQIHFLGKISDAALQEAYQSAWLFAMPSRNEGFGLVYIEAMQHALPILTSQQDAGQELIENGLTGIVVDLDTTDELARSIVHYLEDPQALEKIGQAGYQRWLTDYSYPSFKQCFQQNLTAFLQPQ